MSARLLGLPNGHWIAPETVAAIVVHPPSVVRTHKHDHRILAQLVVISFRGTHHISFMPGFDEAKDKARELAAAVNAVPALATCAEPAA
jgi:hypothetical protein